MLKRFLLFSALSLLCPTVAQAACSTPTANAGASAYFSADKKYKFCDGTNWKDYLCPNSGSDVLGQPTTFSFDTNAVATANQPNGIAADGTYLWVTDTTDDRVYRFLKDGTYTGFSFSTAAAGAAPIGIVYDGTHLWIVDNSADRLYRYTTAGVYTGTNFSTATAGATGPMDAAWDGTYIWVLNFISGGEKRVYRFNAAGAYTGYSFDISAVSTFPNGIAWDGTHFWVADDGGDGKVFRFTPTGAYENIYFDNRTSNDESNGLDWDGKYFWQVDNDDMEVYQYYATTICTTLGACSSAGYAEYDAGASSYKYCNGTDWIQVDGGTNQGGTTFRAEETGPAPGTTLNGATGVFVVGNYAYVSSDGSSRALSVINISNPNDPVYVSQEVQFSTMWGAEDPIVVGNYAYTVNSSDDSVAIFNISNPNDPVYVTRFTHSSLNGARGLFISGNYAYVTSTFGVVNNSLTLINITTPNSPTLASFEQGPVPNTSLRGAASVVVVGNYAYVVNSTQASLAVIDVSNKSDPVFIAEERGPVPGTSILSGNDLAIQGNYAYITASPGLVVIDISNPADPVYVGVEAHPNLLGSNNIHISGNYAYITKDNTASLSVVDISNPADPVFITSERGPMVGHSLRGANGVFVVGSRAYVAAEDHHALAIIDFTPPTGVIPGTSCTVNGAINYNATTNKLLFCHASIWRLMAQ